jgi:hypothetical protein
MYGSADSVVPPAQSRTVAREAGGPTTTIEAPGAEHIDVALSDGPRLVDATARLAVRVAGG